MSSTESGSPARRLTSSGFFYFPPPEASQPAELLRAIPLLAALPEEVRTRVAKEAKPVRLGAGKWLFHEGDPAQSAYVVSSGRLEVVAEGPPPVVIRQLKRGAVLGELALLADRPRSAGIRARRDTELLELDRQAFEVLIREAPEFAIALTRTIGAQLAASHVPPQVATPPRTIAVVPLDGAAPTRFVADALARELDRCARTVHLRPEPQLVPADFPGLIDQMEATYEFVLLSAEATSRGDAWTEFCLREADLVLAVAAGVPDRLWLKSTEALQGCELLVTGVRLAEDVVDRLSPREIQCVDGDPALRRAIGTTARRLAGRAIGVVLSGGGAKAFAHLGVLEELSVRGVRIERIGGTSMGSIISALIACGYSPAETYEILDENFVRKNPSNDYTLPLFSLIRGQKTRRQLGSVFGSRRIEDLPVRFFCVSCDLVNREAIVHRSGLVADAVMASLSIPGVFPPIVRGDRILVDGGVLDNLPVETMARTAEGPVIAVDVSQRGGVTAKVPRPMFQRLAPGLRRALTGGVEPVPRVGETLMRTLTLGSADTVTMARRHADIVITPRVDGIGMLDWKRLPEVREMGREGAREALTASNQLLAEWAG